MYLIQEFISSINEAEVSWDICLLTSDDVKYLPLTKPWDFDQNAALWSFGANQGNFYLSVL